MTEEIETEECFTVMYFTWESPWDGVTTPHKYSVYSWHSESVQFRMTTLKGPSLSLQLWNTSYTPTLTQYKVPLIPDIYPVCFPWSLTFTQYAFPDPWHLPSTHPLIPFTYPVSILWSLTFIIVLSFVPLLFQIACHVEHCVNHHIINEVLSGKRQLQENLLVWV